MRVLNHVRELRFVHGNMTQKALAERLGVSRQTIIAIENGRYSPSLELAMRLCASFGRRVEEVFELEHQ